MKYVKIYLLLLGLLAAGAARAQGKLTGVVQDSVTHEPLAFASVFLANTTLGATTNELGQFEFARIPKGTYDVVGSYVGYRLGKQPFTASAAPQQLALHLAPTGNQLGEVVVEPAPNKPEEYQQFSALLLGGSTFSAQCRISNPERVRVAYDDSTHELTARTKEFLQIDNEALGYRLKYYGLYFAYSTAAHSVTYYGEPVFEEMTPHDAAQQQQWQANCATAYAGSLMHFVRAVYTNTLKANNFLAQQVRNTPKGLVLNPAARPADSLRRVSADGQHTYLRFRGPLQVAYFGEAPDPRYAKPMKSLGATRTPYPALRQVSRLELLADEAEIQADGSVLDPLDLSVGDYWGFEKIGEFLPYDYAPPTPSTPPPPATP